MNIVQLSRFVLASSWIYHGLFPKLLFLAPLEQEMSGSIGLSEPNTLLLIKSAGIAEIVFGTLTLVLYRNTKILYLNILAFAALLCFVILMTPHLMAEAFNPVTTNIPLMVLAFVLLQDAKKP